MKTIHQFGAALMALALATSPALAQTGTSATTATVTTKAADRAEILAMAGNFKVRFDMQESTSWVTGYTPLERKTSGGHEVVRVVEDSPNRIVLQHLLVAEHGGKTMIIKHWRQDWEYEPARILAYRGEGKWVWEDIPEDRRTGFWSQTVYQVDDSPRYSGIGRFDTQMGVRRWRSSWTWRPLARRDAIRDPVYDRYLSINRHQTSPEGWVHWQDNTKIALEGGKLKPIVQEYVLNTYTRFDDYNVKAADDYWAKTQAYWTAVRAAWDRVAATKGGIAIPEEAQTGTVISGRLLSIADEIVAGKTGEADAIREATGLIDQRTTRIEQAIAVPAFVEPGSVGGQPTN